jgi:hypothetical protein
MFCHFSSSRGIVVLQRRSDEKASPAKRQGRGRAYRAWWEARQTVPTLTEAGS